ncbi:beta-amyloid precursor protein C-terminus [Nesidiocoris tenuis]|uniref:Beta-amyloid protein C-terminus n=1 Tax=Nesidiocoris tenuis TaxID=355587 RepID=A0ABN7AQ72_9HEMI|nr:beta-amyloid precursor protein C-terminus [Nesidiocoris tenuis]
MYQISGGPPLCGFGRIKVRIWPSLLAETVDFGPYHNTEGSGEVPVAHFEPQVAMLCHSKDEAYHSQYMTENGRWATDTTHKFTCPKEKMDILDYCKKVYPKHDITNIVESSHFVKISNWCKVGHPKCKHTAWVKPFRCLEGPFQSDALLVPENCLFDHIHNQTKCWEFVKWNQTATQACQDRDMSLRTFAMLLPCGISLFSGVEFVCCPTKADKALKKSVVPALPMGGSEVFDNVDDTDTDDADSDIDDDSDADDDEDDDDDDEYDGYDDGVTSSSSSRSSTVPSTTSTTTDMPRASTGIPTPDPYFTNFDPKAEHQAYKEAQQRLEELHREKVTKVMKDWSDLEERYQDMRSSDPKLAEEFKQRMTLRFQQTVQSLEEEGNAEKHQLVAMHQQRVMAHINQRKKEAMTCYTQALNDSPINTHRVQKCLQKLLRSLHKDRHHTISHYRHLLTSSLEQAEREKSVTLEHLVDIDHLVNQSLQMLDRYPELSSKISQLMSDYMQALRSKDDTPGSLLSMTREAEAAILDKYRAEVTAMQEDKERERVLEKERKEAHKRERTELREETRKLGHADSSEERSTETVIPSSEPNNSPLPILSEHQPQPYAHAMTHDVSHNEATYSVRREVFHRETKSVYFTLAFAGIALMVAMLIGVAVLRRRNARSPQNQGFIEVDQAATPEERHVANMQINGYENPTYKYFEVKDNCE